LEDRECTDRLTRAAKILGIRVLDHVIFGETDYFSFADAGILADINSLAWQASLLSSPRSGRHTVSRDSRVSPFADAGLLRNLRQRI
jgi:hypothetical protein